MEPGHLFLSFNIKFLCVLGLWPSLRVYKYALGVTLIALFLFLGLELVACYHKWGQLYYMTRLVSQVFVNAQFIFKIIYLQTRQETVRSFTDILKQSLAMDKATRASCNRQARGLTSIFVSLSAITGITWLVLPFVDGEQDSDGSRKLPFETWTPWSMSKPGAYYTTYALHVWHGAIFMLYVPAWDLFFLNVIIYMCGLFRALHRSLEGTHSLHDCVQQHQELLRLAQQLESLLNPVMLVQLMMSSGAACVVAFQLSVASLQSLRFVTMLTFLGSILFELSIFNWFATQLKMHSLEVADTVYGRKWLRESPDMQRSIVCIIARAQKPVTLTCGKMYDMSLENLTEVLKTCFSICMLLRTLYET